MMSGNVEKFEYVLIEGFQFTDLFRGSYLVIMLLVLISLAGFFLGIISERTDSPSRGLHFFEKHTLVFVIASVFSVALAPFFIVQERGSRQEALTKSVIAEDYGFDATNVSSDYMFNRYSTSTDVNDVVLQDGERSLQCKQFIALKDSTYHIECYDQTVLKPLSR